MVSPKQASSGAEVDEKFAALLTNASAVRAIASAVEGTIGPKGLDTLLVDRFGEVVITNDGMTILTKMDVHHPAARMVVSTAKAQEQEVGDGTTTATIMAGSLLAEGLNQALRGVPVTKLIDGLKTGVKMAQEIMASRARRISSLDDPLLRQVALIAGRGHEDIADLVISASRMVGMEKLLDPRFKLAETILAVEGADNQVFAGVIIGKERFSREMPKEVKRAKVLVIDDSLEPEKVEEEALATESGFRRYLELQDEFKANLKKVIDLGVNFCIVDGGMSDLAEEILTDAGVMVVSRVPSRELRRAAEHTGARALKRTSLKKTSAELLKYLGSAERVYEDDELEHIRILGGEGKPMATILVGAATREVMGERERICTDAASSVQAAVKGGVVAGGGAVEIACSRALEGKRDSFDGMSAYGLLCVIEALKKPLAQIVANAGFNPLEKVGAVLAAQARTGNDNLAVDCDTGEIVDMFERGVVDPALVKIHALKAAGEIAEAILRINTIIKKKDDEEAGAGSGEDVEDVNI